ncbi:hypothetical protein G6F56_000173 [Rhizopus delemar]|nr:hypothetical protein G6F56_000173 [Rhizopus delemar]
MSRPYKRHHADTHINNTSNTTLTPSVPTLTPAQMYSNFEEWIKMCTDNKVNASNTWDFSLIDYFHEMTFIREGDSINFQKASCTLDGCVKIYTSRVDSVATETGKLLSGLVDSSNDNENEEVRKERIMRRKSQRTSTPLVKDFSTLALKKFDLDFAVDPLFKKTSADFDEGGARGLLLNHLSVDRFCKIIFDASDSTVDHKKDEGDEGYNEGDETDTVENEDVDNVSDEEEEEDNVSDKKEEGEAMEIDDENAEQEENSLEQPENAEQENTAMEEDPLATFEDKNNSLEIQIPDKSSSVEISRLKARVPDLQSMDDHSTVPSLESFDFFSDDLVIPELHSEEEEENHPNEDKNEIALMPDYGDDFDFDVDVDPFNFEDQQGFDEQVEGVDETEKAFPEKDYLTALLNNENKDLFNYFDTTLAKDWAGPEHWKLRKPPVVKETTNGNENNKAKKTYSVETAIETEEKGTKKKAKQTTLIDFTETEEDEDIETMFEPATRKPLLPSSTANASKYLLPDDIHFSSKQFLRYFLKPMFPTDEKKKNSNNNHERGNDTSSTALEEEGEPDASFWAEQTQDYGDYDVDIDCGNSIPGDMVDNHESNTYDDLEISDIYGDTLITGHQLKRAQPLYVNYARTAKRVDVKKLKHNLWKALVPEEEQVKGKFKFIDILNNLKRMYPPKEMKDISVPYCFICLLHLANEKNLVLTNDENDDDFVLGDEDWMKDESKLSNFVVYQN